MPKYTIRCELIKTFTLTVEAPSYEAAHRYYAGPDLDEDLFSEEGEGIFKLVELARLPEESATTPEVEVDPHGNACSS
tara:strand:+ start:915 stop:1148 length:234 start_codon:yes stop_codon:yes gene_type:complete